MLMMMNHWMSKATATKSTNGPDSDVSEPVLYYKEALPVIYKMEKFLRWNFKLNSIIRLGVGMQVCKTGDEETEDVVVDGDDTAAFGPTQFNENDIQAATADQSSQAEGT